MLFIDSNTLHVSGVTRLSSGVQETVCSLVSYSIILDSVFLFPLRYLTLSADDICVVICFVYNEREQV